MEHYQSIAAHGFERILILSGHGGNRGAIDAAAQEMRHQLKRPIYGACWFDLATAHLMLHALWRAYQFLHAPALMHWMPGPTRNLGGWLARRRCK